MPIDRSELKNLGETHLRGSMQRKIYIFLKENKEYAYTRAELSHILGVNDGQIYAPLIRLEQKGLIERKAPYWAYREK